MGRLNRKLNLNVLSQDEADQIRESHISQSMSGMKGAIRQLDVDVNVTREAIPAPQATPRYEGTELADVARDVYRENINPVKVEYQDEGPDTHARRVEKRSIQRAIMGLRNGGDEGKTSMVGPNGSGNVGKYSPSAESGSGNATNNTDNYYALTTDMTLEEYQEHIDSKLNEALGTLAGIGGGALLGNALGGAAGAALPTSKGILGLMGGKAAGVGAGKALGSVGGAVAGGVAGNQLDKKEKKEVKEDAVKDLKLELMKMEDTSWQAIDKVMRQIAKDNYMTPKELHKEFKSQNDGQIPDEWIKEHREVEMAGFIPLQELARLNPVGVIYTVSYMYRGGTQRRKFLVPHMNPPTKEEMEEYVRGFWPFARVLAYYPDPIENQQNNNSMVAVPPITEKYYFYTPEDWVTLSEEEVEIYNTICEEEGEPLTSPEQQEDGTYLLLVADHDTGEQKYITFGEGKKEEDRKDAMPKGDVGHDIHKRAVAQYNKQNPSKKVEESYDDPGDERKITRQGAERQNAVAKLMQDKEMQKKMDDAIAKSVARDKARGRVPGLPEPFKLRKRKVEESYDDPGDERKITRQGAERQNAVAKLMQDKEMQKRMDDAIAKSVARDKARGRVPGLPEPFKLRKREEQKEEYEIDEAAPFIAAGAGKLAGSLAGKGIAKATAGQAAKGGLRKKAADYATRKGTEKAQQKVTDMLTDKEEVNEEKDKKGKGSGKKDACYSKVKSRYDVWPSAYASGALVKCRQKGAANWGNSDKKKD